MTDTYIASWTHTLKTTIFAATTPLLLGGAALLGGCADDQVDGELDAGELALREEEEKIELFDPPPPPLPPGPEADAGDALPLNGKPKKVKNVGPKDIKGRYIVKMKADADPDAAVADVAAQPDHVFKKSMRGFAGALSPGQLKKLEMRADVEFIEPDQIVTADTTQLMDPAGQPWGLDRIDQRTGALDGQYEYFRDGWGVRAYIIDTGIQSNHPDFFNALAMFDAFGGNGQDCHGHGTHVAGTIGGTVHGVAKRSFLRGVRVLNCSGKGTISGIIAGVEWVAKNHIKPAVANMSLGAGKSAALNAAVDRLADSGVFVAVAAGNNAAPACNYSPASASKAFAAGASDKTDRRAVWSNYGPCVAAYAPGVGIRSTWIGSATGSASGTSMASPHVAGTAALYKAVFGDAPWSTVKAKLVEWATRDRVAGNPTGTPNLLLYQPL
ncbi:S8 family peptidase [Nannocystis pusilla]|uniref:S8 family peptidase n=1 Tax=Nannocystis pusilla TaxID=889268 RepID=A0ABS7U3F0_9BACT|nr:S8 family peptidase [Nannocystis pusilla]MBZ5714954.1 S8 family peptidase [Nannocystis pusilla]